MRSTIKSGCRSLGCEVRFPICPCCSEPCFIRCRWRRRISPSGAVVLTTANSMRGPSSCPPSHFNCGISPAAWTGFAATRRAAPLSQEQLQALASEMTASGTREDIFSELEASLDKTRQRLRENCPPAGRYAGQDRPQRPAHYPHRTFGPRRRAYPAACRAGDYHRKGDCGPSLAAPARGR